MPLKPVDRLPHSLSLRTQLVLVTSVLIALAIAVTSLVAISALRAQMVHQLDEEMKASSSSLVSSVGTSQTRQDGAVGSYRVYVLDQHGNVLHSIAGADQQAENEPVLTGWDSEKVKKYHETGTTVNSRTGSNDWRIMPISLESSTNGQASSMVIALPLKQTNQVVALVGVLTFAFGLATLAAAIAMTWVIVTRAFEPLARVEQTAAKIAAGDLSQRIEDYNPSNEIGNLAISLNTMLAQIESSFNAQAKSEAKMRRFVGDASHELRTPLVSIRGYSELYRQGALPNDEAVATAMGRIESESKRMGQLVEDLLTLARIDERRESKLAPFDLFANLLTNAMRYTPAGTPLEIAVGVREDVPGYPLSVIEVRDHGPGIHGEDRERVFERFYRTDTSRSRETGGTGLGLSIVAAILEQHDGSVHIEETPGGGATFVISLPFYPAPVMTDNSVSQ